LHVAVLGEGLDNEFGNIGHGFFLVAAWERGIQMEGEHDAKETILTIRFLRFDASVSRQTDLPGKADFW
jgi:hypothetical protein